MSEISPGSVDANAELVLAAATAVADSALQAGSRAPMFRLPDAAGRMFALEQLLRHGPVVLHFYRGNWCSYGERSQDVFRSTYEQVTALGASAVAISPDLASGQPVHGLSVPDLHDQDLRVAGSYGLAFELPPQLRTTYQQLGYQPTSRGAWLVPMPAIYLLDRDGTVVLASLELDYRKTYRPEPLLQALRAIQARHSSPVQRLF